MSRLTSRFRERLIGMAFVVSVAPTVAVAAAVHSAAASGPPSVSLTPQGNYHDGQTLVVAVGPNSYFTPNARIVILECADPGGSASNLPIDATTCDGNTVQGGTVLVSANGSFSQSGYPVYLLPSPTLGEQSNYKPICNQTNYCVLYVGQDQNNFTAPKVFSTPFLIDPSAGDAGTTSTNGGSTAGSGAAGTTGTTAAPTSSSTSAGAAVSLATSASLANTGPPAELEWVALSGMALLLCGVVGRRILVRSAP